MTRGNQFTDLPPHDRDAERCVLSAMMLSPDALADPDVARLASGDFFIPAHQLVFEAITALAAEGAPADAIAVAARLTKLRQFAKVGAGPGLHTILEAAPTAANAGYYAQIVRGHSIDRHMIEAGSAIEQAGWGDGDRADRIEYAYRVLDDAAGLAAPARAAPLAELLPGALDRIEEGPAARLGLPLGWDGLDELTGGARPGQLIIVASRPAAGKTVILLNAAGHIAQAGTPVLLCSAEQPAHEVIERILAAEAGVNLSRIRDGTVSDEDWARIAKVHGALSDAPLMINDNPGIGLAGIRSDLRAMARAGTPAGVVIVDYLQLIAGGLPDNREREVGELSRGLKLIGRDHKIPVIAAAQLNRGPEMRADHRPLLADLRDSGSVEQDADVVVLLYRPGMYDESAGDGMDLIVAKNRSGPAGTVELAWRGYYARADSIAWTTTLVLERFPQGPGEDDPRDI